MNVYVLRFLEQMTEEQAYTEFIGHHNICSTWNEISIQNNWLMKKMFNFFSVHPQPRTREELVPSS